MRVAVNRLCDKGTHLPSRAEWIEAGPGRKQVANSIGPMPEAGCLHPAERKHLAERLKPFQPCPDFGLGVSPLLHREPVLKTAWFFAILLFVLPAEIS